MDRRTYYRRKKENTEERGYRNCLLRVFFCLGVLFW